MQEIIHRSIELIGAVLAKVEGSANDPQQKKLLDILVKSTSLSPDDLRDLLGAMDNFDVVAKVFLLEGVPFVFSSSPMRYLIFREQVADRFEIGYQDVCIVGSAKLGLARLRTSSGRPSPKPRMLTL